MQVSTTDQIAPLVSAPYRSSARIYVGVAAGLEYVQLPSVKETLFTYVARTILTAHTLDTNED